VKQNVIQGFSSLLCSSNKYFQIVNYLFLIPTLEIPGVQFSIQPVGLILLLLSAATILAKKGFNVTIFEKKDKIGKEACSGLFSERIINFIPESEKLIKKYNRVCPDKFP
jgi:hypothetical protein